MTCPCERVMLLVYIRRNLYETPAIRLLALMLGCALLMLFTTGCDLDDFMEIVTGTQEPEVQVIVPSQDQNTQVPGDYNPPVGGGLFSDTTTTTTTTMITADITTTPRMYRYVVAEGGLRMREQPSANGAIILTIPNESRVELLDEQKDWSYVRYKGEEGWCANSWLFVSISAATTTAKPVELTEKKALKIAKELIESYAQGDWEVTIERFNDATIIAAAVNRSTNESFRFHIEKVGGSYIITEVE